LNGIQQIVGVIDTTHVPLSFQQFRKIIIAPKKIHNHKHFFYMVVQGICDANNFFWSVCVGQFSGVHQGGQFKYFTLYKFLFFSHTSLKITKFVNLLQLTKFNLMFQ
jgi:hypothetical protein